MSNHNSYSNRSTGLLMAACLSGCSLIVPGNGGLTPDLVDGGTQRTDAGRDGGRGEDRDAAPDANCAPSTYYLDADRDRAGDPGSAIEACAPPTRDHVEVSGDCDDTDVLIHPGAEESCDGVDQDCDRAIDEGLMGPIGDTITLDTGVGAEFSIVGTPLGSFVAWDGPAGSRLRTAFVPADPAVAPTTTMGPTPIRGTGQLSPRTILFESEILEPQVALVWSETDVVRMQILPADASTPPGPFTLVDAAGSQLPELSPLAVVGDRIAAFWIADSSGGVIGARLVDPVAAAPASSAQMIDLDPADETSATLLVGWTGLDDPSTLLGVRFAAMGGLNVDFVAFDVSESSITWRGDGATLSNDPSLGDLVRAGISQPPRGETSVPLFSLWDDGSGPAECFARVAPGPSGPPQMLECVPLELPTVGMAFRGALASLVVQRSEAQLALVERPLSPTAEGAPLVTIAERTIGGNVGIGVYGDHGAVAFRDEDAVTGDPKLMLQRIGCR